MTQSLQSTSTEVLFSSDSKMQVIAEKALATAKGLGASGASVALSEEEGFSVSVRSGDVENIEFNRDKVLGVTVYMGQRKGSATTSDTSDEAIQAAVKAACNIGSHTGEDPCHGLADADSLAQTPQDFSLHHPWHMDPEHAIELGKRTEAAGLAVEGISNTEGATVVTHQAKRLFANSLGFLGHALTSRHSVSCSLITEKEGAMERDYEYTLARDPRDLVRAELVGQLAAEKAIARVGPRRLPTQKVPVIFRADVANSLLSNFTSAISGARLYRKSSFLVESLGQSLFPDFIRITEDPFILKGLGSAWFDAEGVATQQRDIVRDGVLQGYCLSSYSARKLGMSSTGNAGGVHNLIVEPTDGDLKALCQKMGTGLLATELMGQGVNLVTGDYSRGVAGFWVENGEIQYPVSEVTIAGNLKDMFKHIVAVGSDVDVRRTMRTGSILIENMTLAGE